MRRQLNHKTIALALLMISIFIFTVQGAAFAAESKKNLRVALVLIGPISDGSFNAAAYEGLTALKSEFGAEISFAESVPVPEFEETMWIYAEQGYDVVIGHGFEFGEPASKVAPKYPDTLFMVTNGNVSGPNLASLEPLFEEAGYLAGALAGLMTKSGKVGAIGGMEFPIIVRGIEAFGIGAKAVNPNVKATTAYIGSLVDVAKGKEAAIAQISTGVDTVFHIANEAGVGVIQACREASGYAVGFAFDQNSLAPKTVITSVLSSYRILLVEAIRRILDGKFKGEIQKYGLETGVMDISPYHGLVPDELAKKVQQIREDIVAGKIDIPRISIPPQK